MKEAVAKAVGLGLSLPFTSITLSPSTPPQIRISDNRPQVGKSWDYREIRPTPDHMVAVVAETGGEAPSGLADLRWRMLEETELNDKVQK